MWVLHLVRKYLCPDQGLLTDLKRDASELLALVRLDDFVGTSCQIFSDLTIFSQHTSNDLTVHGTSFALPSATSRGSAGPL